MRPLPFVSLSLPVHAGLTLAVDDRRYDTFKGMLMSTGFFKEGLALYFASSFMAVRPSLASPSALHRH